VATDSLLELQVTFLLVAFSGMMFAFSWVTSPSSNFNELLSIETSSTGILFVTTTQQKSVCPPSSVATKISAYPFLTALTFPFLSTVATFSLSEIQVTFLLVASSGKTVAVSWSVSPLFNFNELLSNITPVTGTRFLVTLTSQVSVLLPSSVVATIVAFPSLIALTFPS